MRAETNQLGLEVLFLENRGELDWALGSLQKVLELGHSLVAHLELSSWLEDAGRPRYPIVLCYTDASLAIEAMKSRRTGED